MNTKSTENPQLYFANPENINDGTWIDITDDEFQIAEEIKYHCSSYLDTWEIRAAVGYKDLPIETFNQTKSLQTYIDLSYVVKRYSRKVIKKVVAKLGTEKAVEILNNWQYVGTVLEQIDFMTTDFGLYISKDLYEFVDWEKVFTKLDGVHTYVVIDNMVWKTIVYN